MNVRNALERSHDAGSDWIQPHLYTVLPLCLALLQAANISHWLHLNPSSSSEPLTTNGFFQVSQRCRHQKQILPFSVIFLDRTNTMMTVWTEKSCNSNFGGFLIRFIDYYNNCTQKSQLMLLKRGAIITWQLHSTKSITVETNSHWMHGGNKAVVVVVVEGKK